MMDYQKLDRILSKSKMKRLEEFLKNLPESLKEKAEIVTMPKDTLFIENGKSVNKIYILVKGRVKAADYRINEVVYDYTWFEPIELFGAMEFYMGYEKYITTLITMSECVMITFTMQQFRQWIQNDIDTMLSQVKIMMNRLNDQSSKERAFMFLSGQERLMYVLTKIFHEHEREGECVVQMTQEELANHSGINLRTATRAIQKLCENGKLTKRSRKLFINLEQCSWMEQQLKVIVDGGCSNDGEEENNFRL